MIVYGRVEPGQPEVEDMDIKQIGNALGVATVLDGSVRTSGNRVRITAQLITTEDGYQLWSDKFDREMDDIFSIQDEIARRITDRLKVKLVADSVVMSWIRGSRWRTTCFAGSMRSKANMLRLWSRRKKV